MYIKDSFENDLRIIESFIHTLVRHGKEFYKLKLLIGPQGGGGEGLSGSELRTPTPLSSTLYPLIDPMLQGFVKDVKTVDILN